MQKKRNADVTRDKGVSYEVTVPNLTEPNQPCYICLTLTVLGIWKA